MTDPIAAEKRDEIRRHRNDIAVLEEECRQRGWPVTDVFGSELSFGPAEVRLPCEARDATPEQREEIRAWLGELMRGIERGVW